MHLNSSFRFLSNSDFDVDAYLLESGKYFIFITLKSDFQWSDSSIKEVLNGFTAPIEAVGGALKFTKKSTPLPLLFSNEKKFICLEGSLKFELQSQEVLNPGLFLDQSHNRELLDLFYKKIPEKKSFLNLFCYTGAFSIQAIESGFTSVTSVDLSANYLKWVDRNEKLNIKKSVEHRKITEDAVKFVEREIKRKVQYSWIVIDPPTFSRSRSSDFRVQKDLPDLVEGAVQILEKKPGCGIFVSCNDSRWNKKDFLNTMNSIGQKYGLKITEGKTSSGFLRSHPLKSCFLILA